MKFWTLGAKIAKFTQQYYSPLVDLGNSGTAKTVDWDAGNEQRVVLTGNVVLTFSNPVNGGRYVLAAYSGAGAFTITWPASVLWPGGVAPVMTVTAARTDLFTFIYVATTGKYHGAFSQDYAG